MTRADTLPIRQEDAAYTAKDLLVAYDFSSAADTCLKYAIMLSKRLGSFVHLISVQSPSEYADALEAGPSAMGASHRNRQAELQALQEKLQEKGILSDAVRRTGNVSDILWEATMELKPDLLLFGAFGHSPTDRLQLGSTAEHLLRTIRCPALIVGPHAILKEDEAPPIRRILCATTSLESPDEIVSFAGSLAARMEAQIELLNSVDPAQEGLSSHHHERRSEEWSQKLRRQGVRATWTLLYGPPGEVIPSRAKETNASLILFGLHHRGNRMVDCPDGVVSSAVRHARCPVMTVPLALPL